MAQNELLISVIKLLEAILEDTKADEVTVMAEQEPYGFPRALTFIVYDRDKQRKGLRISYEMIEESAIELLPGICSKLKP